MGLQRFSSDGWTLDLLLRGAVGGSSCHSGTLVSSWWPRAALLAIPESSAISIFMGIFSKSSCLHMLECLPFMGSSQGVS